MRKSTRAWFCRQCAKVTADRRSPSLSFRRRPSPYGNARSRNEKADNGLDSTEACPAAIPDGTRRMMTRCILPVESAVPTPACYCALRLLSSPRPVRDGRPCIQIDRAYAESADAGETVVHSHRLGSLLLIQHDSWCSGRPLLDRATKSAEFLPENDVAV